MDTLEQPGAEVVDSNILQADAEITENVVLEHVEDRVSDIHAAVAVAILEDNGED